MRYGRFKAAPDAKVAYYHCCSRIVDKRYVLLDLEREHFMGLVRAYETFSGVQVVTFCILNDHFHLLIKVPHRPADLDLPTDEQLVALVKVIDGSYPHRQLAMDLKALRDSGSDAAAEKLRERFFRRMWDISPFLQILKQRFTQWYNARNHRTGTLWEGRFHSVLVEGAGEALAAMAAYIDLNPVRARMMHDPKGYRWCGYGQACAGKERAREGLRIVTEATGLEGLSLGQATREYRKHLFKKGEVSGTDGTRAGFSPEEVKAVLKTGGKLEIHDALLCRVRYFCEGVIFGSKKFVEELFNANRWRFGASRTTGARPMRGMDCPGLFTVRDLRDPVIP